MTEHRTDRQIVELCNELAIKLMSHMGFKVQGDRRLYDSEHPRAQLAWGMAIEAFAVIEGTDVADALIEVREQDRDAEIAKFQFNPVI